MALRAKKPEFVEKRIKLFLFGDYGTGKTTAAISFPKSYVIDCEKGAENKQYIDVMKKNKSEIFRTNDVDEVIQETKSLISEKHDFKTVIIDPVTVLETDLIDKVQKRYAEERAEKNAGGFKKSSETDMRVWRDRDNAFRRMSNLLIKADMNVILTAHGKIDYGENMTKLGTTFDGWKRWPYLFDLVIELKKIGNRRLGYVRKTRVDNFKDGEEFEWSSEGVGFYGEFKKRYGEIIEKEATTIKLATPEQVEEVKRLIQIVKIPEDKIEKWMSKAQADDWDEFSEKDLSGCISYLKETINGKKEDKKE